MSFYHKYKKYKSKYLNMKKQIGGQDYEISIQNPRDTPWLDWIDNGIKEYEGRLNRGIFKTMKIGDKVIWYDRRSNKRVKTEIVKLEYYKNFEEAFDELGNKLVPINNATVEIVNGLYSKYFTKQEIEMSGVVAIGLKVIR